MDVPALEVYTVGCRVCCRPHHRACFGTALSSLSRHPATTRIALPLATLRAQSKRCNNPADAINSMRAFVGRTRHSCCPPRLCYLLETECARLEKRDRQLPYLHALPPAKLALVLIAVAATCGSCYRFIMPWIVVTIMLFFNTSTTMLPLLLLSATQWAAIATPVHQCAWHGAEQQHLFPIMPASSQLRLRATVDAIIVAPDGAAHVHIRCASDEHLGENKCDLEVGWGTRRHATAAILFARTSCNVARHIS